MTRECQHDIPPVQPATRKRGQLCECAECGAPIVRGGVSSCCGTVHASCLTTHESHCGQEEEAC